MSTLSTFFFTCYGDLPDLHSFPTRRSSDLQPLLFRKLPERFLKFLSHLLALEPMTWLVVLGHPLTAARFGLPGDRKSTRLNSSHSQISYAVFCLKKKTVNITMLSSSLLHHL